MKKITLTFLSIVMFLMSANLFAQGKYGADSANCIKYLSYYKDYFKQKSYDDALRNWREAYKRCPPSSRQTMLIDGTTLMRNIANKESDQAKKLAVVDTLLTLHDQRAQYFPTYAVTALNNKGLDASKFYSKDTEKAHEIYESVIAANKEKVNPSILVLNMNTVLDLYNIQKLSTEDVINSYETALELIEKAPAKTDADKEKNAQVKTDLESLFINSKVASCDELQKLFAPRLAANPSDTNLVNSIVKTLALAENCTDNDLFLKAVTAMYNNKPSASSAYYLYRLNNSKGNNSEALRYLEEAISYPDLDNKTKANYQFELATINLKNGQNARAMSAAQKAAELDHSYQGKAYYLIGTIWGSTPCGGGYIESRARYWVAVDYLQRAKNADSSLTEDANRLIGQYSVYYPEKAEAFMYDVSDGQSYTAHCGGMSATTTVRTR